MGLQMVRQIGREIRDPCQPCVNALGAGALGSLSQVEGDGFVDNPRKTFLAACGRKLKEGGPVFSAELDRGSQIDVSCVVLPRS